MRELSIFIDESGDFGSYEHHCPYYLMTLVFHNQSDLIAEEIDYLRKRVSECGFNNAHAVHAEPLVRPGDGHCWRRRLRSPLHSLAAIAARLWACSLEGKASSSPD